MKPVPVTVSVVETAPTVALTGATAEITGTGAFTASETTFEVPPSGGGFVTVSGRVPGASRSDALRLVVNVGEVTKIVGRVAPLIATVDCETKLVPVTVIVVEAEPARTPEGESDAM